MRPRQRGLRSEVGAALLLAVVFGAACREPSRSAQPPAEAAEAPPRHQRPDLDFPLHDPVAPATRQTMRADAAGWDLGGGSVVRAGTDALELRAGAGVLARLVDDRHGGVEVQSLAGPRYRITGLDEGALVILDERGVALLRARRNGAHADGADGARRALGQAQVEAGNVAIFTADGTPTDRVLGVADPAIGLALAQPGIPVSVRVLLAAHASRWP